MDVGTMQALTQIFSIISHNLNIFNLFTKPIKLDPLILTIWLNFPKRYSEILSISICNRDNPYTYTV